MLNFRRNTFSRFSNCRIFFFPSSISAVNSSRVFSLGFVMVGCSFLPVGHRKRTVDFLGCPLWYILFWCQLLVNEYFFSIDDRRYNFYNFFGFHLFCDYLIFDTVIFKFSHIHIIVARRFVRVRVIRNHRAWNDTQR